jgi:hypothetical protein
LILECAGVVGVPAPEGTAGSDRRAAGDVLAGVGDRLPDLVEFLRQ